VDRQALDVEVTALTSDAAPDPTVVVVQALPKGDRGELAVELLTEVGVDEIVPWAAAACVTRWRPDRLDRAHRRWADAALAAGKQSRRTRFPVVAPLATTAQVADRVAEAALAVVLDESSTTALADVTMPETGEVVVIVGPEGGITATERADFEAVGARSVRLGPSVLRTSSAGMAAAAVLLAPSRRWAVHDTDGMEG
jgi:16S rRNA (uracil1498-N3)-methyltransferase